MSRGEKTNQIQVISIVGLVLLIIAIPFTIAALRLFLDVGSSADPQAEPFEIVVSNITESSATISWQTAIETEGLLKYGTSADNLNLVANDMRDLGADEVQSYMQHIVPIKNLSTNTTYYFQIVSDGEEYEGALGEFSTFGLGEDVAVPKTLKGQVSNQTPYNLVYTYATNNRNVSEIRSTYTSTNGTFTFDIANLRTADGSAKFPTEGIKFVTYVNGMEDGKARVIHDSDEDPGEISLDAESGIEFDPNVQVDLDIEPEPEPEPDPEPEPSPTPSPAPSPSPSPTPSNPQRVYDVELVDPTVPQNVFISNISSTSFTINWVTSEPTRGHVIFGETGSDLSRGALDLRDSTDDVERYTHSVRISDSSMQEGDIVYFKIVSNGKEYGETASSAYTFEAPPILENPPSPNAVTGKLNYLAGSRLSNSKRDFLIYARLKDDQMNLSTYISTVPAYQSNGWTLVLNALDNTRENSFDGTEMELEILGEYNSRASRDVTISDQTLQIAISPGLSVDQIRHNQNIRSINVLSGTATAGSTVVMTLDNTSTRLTATADSKGEWVITEANFSEGEYLAGFSDSVQSYSASFFVDMSSLPITSLGSREKTIGIGIALLGAGLALVYWLRRENLY